MAGDRAQRTTTHATRAVLGLVFACLSLACSAAPEAALPTDSAEPAADAATPVEDAPSTTAPTEVSPGPTDEVTDDDAGADTATDRRDPPQSDPDAGRPPADGAIGEPLAVDLTGVPQAPGRLFRVVPADKYHGPPISSSMAIADFNGDGRQDIFVPGQPAAILYNRGDLGFEVYVPDLDWPSFMLSASAMDLDLDGRTDIVLGARGYLQVAFQRADGWELGPAAPTIAGTATPGFTFVPDYDGDGRPDAVVVAQYGWPPGLPGFLTGLEGVEDHESFAGNTLMYIGQGGAMTSLPLSEYAPPAVAECASKMSWTALFLPRHRWGLGGVVWTGNECTDDCWTPYEPNARLLTELLPGDHIGARNGTMGGDYILDGDDILVASSDFAGRDPSIWKLPLTGPVEFVGERLVRTHFDGYDLTWGIVFENSYLLAASGPRVFDDPAWQARFDSAPGSFAKLTSPGRINIFAHDPVTGDYVENHDLLPPQIEGSGWFHIADGPSSWASTAMVM